MELPGVRSIAELSYKLVAKNRSRISARLGWNACAVAPKATTSCPSCEVSTSHPKMVAWSTPRIVVNHFLSESDSRSGWFVVSPRRHVTRWFELTDEEVLDLMRVLRALDRALTDVCGSKRTMIASLGWQTADHLHVHCVPTFDDSVTRGYRNFDGTWRGIDLPAEEVVFLVSARLKELLPPPA